MAQPSPHTRPSGVLDEYVPLKRVVTLKRERDARQREAMVYNRAQVQAQAQVKAKAKKTASGG